MINNVKVLWHFWYNKEQQFKFTKYIFSLREKKKKKQNFKSLLTVTRTSGCKISNVTGYYTEVLLHWSLAHRQMYVSHKLRIMYSSIYLIMTTDMPMDSSFWKFACQFGWLLDLQNNVTSKERPDTISY